MIFEPRLTLEGYRIQSKMGEYTATVQIWDDYFTPMVDQFNRVTMPPPIPETQQFEVPDEGSTKFVTMMCIEYAEDFDYENVWIEYMTYFPDGVICTSNNTEGQTSSCSMDEDGRFHFAFTIEFDFTAADISSFHVRFRIRSEDFWGRQYLAGYGSLTPLLQPGRTDYRVECWRPIKADDPISELREFFIGQAIDIDFFNLKEDGVISRSGLSTQSSGTLHVSVTNVCYKGRDYIAKETLKSHEIRRNVRSYGTFTRARSSGVCEPFPLSLRINAGWNFPRVPIIILAAAVARKFKRIRSVKDGYRNAYTVQIWHKRFKDRETDMEDQPHSGRPSELEDSALLADTKGRAIYHRMSLATQGSGAAAYDA
ncbi:hypothetical protein COOONC_11969 [Cooperia oncophora]